MTARTEKTQTHLVGFGEWLAILVLSTWAQNESNKNFIYLYF